jgi:hypothetical protein
MTFSPTLGPSVFGSVVMQLREELAYRLANEPGTRERYAAGDAAVEEEALGAVCDRFGVTLADYHRAVESDPGLAQLEAHAIREAVVGTADPGP